MDKKIIFFDIDGTIYYPEIGVTNKTKEAIKLLRQNGHLAFIATGRPTSMLEDEFFDIGFDGINAACGTYIVCHGEIMFNKELSDDILNQTIEVAEKYNLHTIFEGKDAMYINKNISEKIFSNLIPYFKFKDWKTHKVSANKLFIKIDNFENFDMAINVIGKYYDLIKYDNNSVELVPKNYNKATGIKYIIEHLNIPWENTYAFGDSANDMEMMQYVNHSVAMGNAVDSIKQISKHITSTIFDDGVYNGLKKLELI